MVFIFYLSYYLFIEYRLFYSSGSSGLLSSRECFSFSVRIPGFFFTSPFLHNTISYKTHKLDKRRSLKYRRMVMLQDTYPDNRRSPTCRLRLFKEWQLYKTKNVHIDYTSQIKRHNNCTCCLKYLLSSSSTRTRFRKYLTENFLLTSLKVGVSS